MGKTKERLTKEQLLPLLARGLSTRELGSVFGRGPTSIRYWLKVYGLETYPKYLAKDATRKCACGEKNPAKFYGHRKTLCGKCHSQYTLKLGQQKKDKARKHLGGKCVACGFNKYNSALAIHHKDPATKDSKFSSMRSWCWERIEKELKGCVLLCHNCHGAYHAGELEIDFNGV